MSKIQELRLKKGLSQSQLAILADMSVRTLQMLEQEQRDINKTAVLTVYNIAKALDVTIEQLINI